MASLLERSQLDSHVKALLQRQARGGAGNAALDGALAGKEGKTTPAPTAAPVYPATTPPPAGATTAASRAPAPPPAATTTAAPPAPAPPPAAPTTPPPAPAPPPPAPTTPPPAAATTAAPAALVAAN